MKMQNENATPKGSPTVLILLTPPCFEKPPKKSKRQARAKGAEKGQISFYEKSESQCAATGCIANSHFLLCALRALCANKSRQKSGKCRRRRK
jgi:hypothetical protein